MSEIESKIRAELEEFWDEQCIPDGAQGATVVEDLIGPMESMTAVDVLSGLDPIVGMKLPTSVIQRGGYETKEEFVEKLTSQVLACVEKKS